MQRKKILKLNQKQIEEIWGEEGPYSEAHLVFSTRILDDRISRVYVEVKLYINPLTYKTIKKHRGEFKDDMLIQDILDQSEYFGQSYGFVSCIFSVQYTGAGSLKKANHSLKRAEDTIIRMHKWIMDYFDVEVN